MALEENKLIEQQKIAPKLNIGYMHSIYVSFLNHLEIFTVVIILLLTPVGSLENRNVSNSFNKRILFSEHHRE